MLIGNISSNTVPQIRHTIVLIQRAAYDNTLIHHKLYNGSQNKSISKYQRADWD